MTWRAKQQPFRPGYGLNDLNGAQQRGAVWRTVAGPKLSTVCPVVGVKHQYGTVVECVQAKVPPRH